MEEAEWRTPIQVVRESIERWDSAGELPPPAYVDTGAEKFSSKLHRAVEAWRLERQKGSKPNATRIAELEALDVISFNQTQEQDFHSATPHVLTDMGLAEQEIALLGDLQEHWPARSAVRMFMLQPTLAHEKQFLVLGGATGTGKSIAAASSLLGCHQRIKLGSGRIVVRWMRTGLFMKAHELVKLQNFGEQAEKAWSRIRERPLLVIDDLGAETMTDWWKGNFADLIDHRMRSGLRTILTTNLTGAELRGRYEERVMRRLTEHGTFVKCSKPAAAVAP